LYFDPLLMMVEAVLFKTVMLQKIAIPYLKPKVGVMFWLVLCFTEYVISDLGILSAAE